MPVYGASGFLKSDNGSDVGFKHGNIEIGMTDGAKQQTAKGRTQFTGSWQSDSEVIRLILSVIRQLR